MKPQLTVFTALFLLFQPKLTAAPVTAASPTEEKPLIQLTRNMPSVQKACFPLWITATTSGLSFLVAVLIHKYKNSEHQMNASGFTSAIFAIGGLQQSYEFFDQLGNCLNQVLFNPKEVNVNKGKHLYPG